ncbi:MAG: hypothetical protein KJS92_06900 [Bacteroidetes bacterium]|nr:hypothetical protein [Bacteroidota bacterium]
MRIFMLWVIFLAPTVASARIWTVDNTPGSGADSSSLQGLIDQKAANGDTIIVMPSTVSYGGINLYKKLFIYSRGHSSNTIDKDRTAMINSIYTSYTGSTSSSGSAIKGLRILGQVSVYSNNIHFQNCFFDATVYLSSSNSLIEGCVFYQSIGFSLVFVVTSPSPSNNIVSHNYFAQILSSGWVSGPNYGFVESGNSTNLIINNIFAEMENGGTIAYGGLTYFRSSYAKIYNNILWSNVSKRARFDTLNYGSVFKNNLTYSHNSAVAKLPGTGNINDTMPVFEGGYSATNLPYYRTNADFRLKSTSPGKNAGTDSTDVGLYGGGYKFSIVGNVPGVAVFDDFEVLNPVIKKGTALKVRILARKPE